MILTPKEKAKELCLKFQHKLFINISDKEENANYVHNDSKQCALISVDEIMEFMKMDDEYTETSSNANSKWVYYWKEVKKEIEKL